MRGFSVSMAGLGAALAARGLMLVLAEPMRRTALHLSNGLASAGRIFDEVLAPLRRAGAEGRDATRPERRRLQAAFAAGSLPVALAFADPVPAVSLAIASALLAPRALVWRRERYTRRLGEGTAAAAARIASALLAPRALVWRRERYTRRLGEGTAAAAARIADALASGHTTRAGIALAARELKGPIGRELSRVTADIELGATADAALAAFRERAGSRRVDLLVAAIRLQRRSGGNLAALLRDVAAALEDQARLEAEAHAETAQARFTSTVVLAMPFFVLGLYELLSPGTIGRLVGSPVGAWLLGTAAVMQATGAVLVRRLARVDP